MAGKTRWARAIIAGISVPGNETRVLTSLSLGSGSLSLRNATVVRQLGLLRIANPVAGTFAQGEVFSLLTETPIASLVDQPSFDFASRLDASYSVLEPWIAGPAQISVDTTPANTFQYDSSPSSMIWIDSKAQRRVLGTSEMSYSLLCSNDSAVTVTIMGTLSILFHLA